MNGLLIEVQNKGASALTEARAYLKSDGRKPLRVQWREGADLWRKYGCFPYHYLKHRLYQQESPPEVGSFMPPNLIRRFRDRLNPEAAREMTLNKVLYTRIMQEAGLPVVPVLAVLESGGKMVDPAGKPLDFPAFVRGLAARGLDGIFVKPTHGCEGRGALKLTLQDESLCAGEGPLTEQAFFRTVFSGAKHSSEYGAYLVQPLLRQHPLIAEMNSASVNTMRIDALKMDDGSVQSSGAFFRVGNGRDWVDNVSAGGFHINVDLQTGELDRYAFGHVKYGRLKCEAHPVSGFRFAGVHLPHWDQVKSLLQAGMDALAPLRYLGWDVAFGEEGPVLMEASAEHDLFVLQCAIGGLAERLIGKTVMADPGFPGRIAIS